jgi:hypothetical protein
MYEVLGLCSVVVARSQWTWEAGQHAGPSSSVVTSPHEPRASGFWNHQSAHRRFTPISPSSRQGHPCTCDTRQILQQHEHDT